MHSTTETDMTLPTNLEIIRATYEGSSEENGRRLLAALAPDAIWTEAAGFPYAGTYTGPEQIVAGVFHKSGKSETGRLESGASWKGLIRKGMILLIVLIACRLDMLLGTTYIRDAVIIAFCANELLSITENAGLMGVPIPKAITKPVSEPVAEPIPEQGYNYEAGL